MDPFTPEQVRAFRESEGLDREQLARRLGVHKDTVRAWESGKRNVGVPASLAMAFVAALREGGKLTKILGGLWTGA